ncbi:hypothetical protein JCM10021v2_006086 [Rhodotorula toruloides]
MPARIYLETCDVAKLALHARELMDRMHATHNVCRYRLFYNWVTDQLGERRRAEVAEEVVRFLQPFWPALGDERMYGKESRGKNRQNVVTELFRALKMVHDLVSRESTLTRRRPSALTVRRDDVKMVHLHVADPPSWSCRGEATLFLPQLSLSVVAAAPEAERASAISQFVVCQSV